MSENTIQEDWIEYWENKGYIVCRATGRIFDNVNFPGVAELRRYELQSGLRLPMDPQWIIHWRQRGFEVDLITGELLEVSHE